MAISTTTLRREMYRVNWLDDTRPVKRDPLQLRIYLLEKRILDLLLVFLTIPIWVPLLAFCALSVKIDSPDGPVFFVQWRTGKGGVRFRMYKFRTMVPNAEQMKKDLAHLNELKWPDFKITNDPRITRIGKILRKTSLDELPQIFNIIKGEMAFVGPRPTSFTSQTYSVWHTQRLDVQPGLTGLWQVIGRGSTEFDERLRLDIAYINRRSMSLDLQILFRTFFAVLNAKGAH